MVIHVGETDVFKGEMLQPFQRFTGQNLAIGDIFQQLLQ